MPEDAELRDVLRSLRDRGAINEASLSHAIRHADRFVAALPDHCPQLLDMGSGGGLPGLVIAIRRPDTAIVLTDRRQRRADLLTMACVRLGLDARVDVVTADVVALGRDARYMARFDAVTARSFGEPLWTAACAVPFLVPLGVIVVSDPPNVDPESRWPAVELARLGLLRSERSFASMCRLELHAPEPSAD